MVNIRFNLVALAGCLALVSCSTSPRVEFASAFDYPEARTYVNCIVDHARKRAFDNKQWFRNDDLDVPILAGFEDCAAANLLFQMRARADGMPESKLGKFSQETWDEAWRLAGDEVVRVRRERLISMGVIR